MALVVIPNSSEISEIVIYLFSWMSPIIFTELFLSMIPKVTHIPFAIIRLILSGLDLIIKCNFHFLLTHANLIHYPSPVPSPFPLE